MDPKALNSLMGSLSVSNSTASSTTLSLKDYEKAIVRAFTKVDREILRISHWSFQGSTAVACWILPASVEDDDDESPLSDSSSFNNGTDDTQQNMPTHTLLTANIGDSRAILSRNKTSVIELTRDHKPNDPIEKKRIEAVGGTIVWHGNIDRQGNPILGTGVWRVNGNLALARAIGDRAERPAVSSEPELSVIRLTREDDFVLIASDGLWDVMTSADCVAYIHALIEETTEELDVVDYDAITSMLVEEALRRGSYDNITVVIIWLQDQQPKPLGEETPT
jgi:protein phosphatase 1L